MLLTLSAMTRRVFFIVMALLSIGVGLIVHLEGAALPDGVRDMVGDALWASMIVWIMSAVLAEARSALRYPAAYAICVLVETSQLYHNATLDAVRATLPGHLVLGSGFDPRDFAAYAIGIISAALIEVSVLRFAATASR